MTSHHRSVVATDLRQKEKIDLELWKKLEQCLFLEQKNNLSQVQAYPTEILQLSSNVTERKTGSGPTNKRLNSSASQKEILDQHVQDEEFEIVGDENHNFQLVSLRETEDIAAYVEKSPRFRAFFIRQKYSWGPLLITSSLFDALIRQAGIPTCICNSILHFGLREREVEIAPPALRFVRLSSEGKATHKSHQCTYGIRYVESNGRFDQENLSKGWSLRQAAVSCRYSANENGSSWLFITISKHMQMLLDFHVAEKKYFEVLNPFEIHLLILQSAVTSWREYMIDLSSEIDMHYAELHGTSPSEEGPVDLHEPGRRQKLLALEETCLNALMAIGATTNTMQGLESAWRSSANLFSFVESPSIELIEDEFQCLSRDLQLISCQLDNLKAKLAGMTNLLSGYLDLSSGFALQNLVKESSKENEQMRILAERSTKDAAAVKVLTIITLVYLPVTVVSNFFSTSFVNTVTAPDGSGKITVYGDWWMLLAISIPLTIVTIYIWIVWVRIQAHPRDHSWCFYIFGVKFLDNLFTTPSNFTAREKDRRNIDEIFNYDSHSLRNRTLKRIGQNFSSFR